MVSSSGIVKSRCGFVQSHGEVGNNLLFYNNSLSVMKRALNERLYFVKSAGGLVPCPEPEDGAFDTLAPLCSRIVNKIPGVPRVWTNQEFVQSYTGPKYKRYLRASQRLGARGPSRHMANWNTFIKAEWYDATIKKDPCPRLIQPRTYEYNILIGRYIRPLEKRLYKGIDKVFKHHVVLKCDSPWQRAKTISTHWQTFNSPCFIGFDASRFDQHCSVASLQYEHSIYNRFYQCPELREYLSWQLSNKGYATCSDGTIKYSVDGKRGSGDMNTSCGNVVIMCSIVYDYLSKLGVHWRFINDGDDGGVMLESSDIHLMDGFADHCLRFGFEMEIEKPVFQIEEIEFCQSNPIELAPGQYMMVRNINKCLKLDRCSINSRNWAMYHEIQHATGLGGLALYQGVPVLDAWYQSMLSDNVRAKVIDRLLEETIHVRSWRTFAHSSFASQNRAIDVDESVARLSVYRAFGITPDQQKSLEASCRAIKFTSHKLPLVNSSKEIQQYYLDR